MTKQISPSVTEFLVRLKKIDNRLLTVRDVLVLVVVMENPGCSGMDIITRLGIRDRSAIASNINRLIREGYILDKREIARKAHPAILHPTPAGLRFWEDIKP